MSFTKKHSETENTEKTNSGITNTIANYIPMATLLFEQITGQSIPQSKGTLADILIHLQKLETKLDEFTRDCSQQFIHQEAQLASLQQVSELISTEKTKAIRFGNTNKFQAIEE